MRLNTGSFIHTSSELSIQNNVFNCFLETSYNLVLHSVPTGQPYKYFSTRKVMMLDVPTYLLVGENIRASIRRKLEQNL